MVNTFELIEINTAETLEELYEMEIRYIIEYNSYYMNEKGYNMTFGGDGANGYIYTEDYKQKQSETMKIYYQDNPNAIKENSERRKKYHQENPEAGKEHGERMKIYYETHPEAREKCSETTKKYYETHPEAGKEHGEKMKRYYQDNPNAIKENSERRKKYYQDNPNAIKEQSERSKKYYENPDTRENMSKIKIKYYKDNLDARQKISDGKGKNNPFDVLTTDGTFIKTFTYQFEAREYLQKEHNITSTIKISEVLSGTRHSSAGFVFKYK